MSLKQKISFGVKWVSISICLTRLARFLTSIVLARILLPEHFGIIALANSILEAIGVIRQLGFGSAFIYKSAESKKDDRILADTTFYLGVIINFAMFFIGIIAAKTIAGFFKAEELEGVLIVLFSSFIIDAIVTVPNLILQKELKFGKQATAEIAQAISYAIIGISAALLDLGVWSLVWAQLGSRLIFGVLVIRFAHWRPGLNFSYKLAVELFDYGKYIWGYVAVGTLGKVLDKFVLGRFWGTTVLGYYSIAFQLSYLPTMLITFLIERVTFPAFSKIKDDRIAMGKGFINILSMVSIICIPLALGLIAVADKLILVVYGTKWEPAVPLVKVLAIYGLAVTLSSVTPPAIKAVGEPKYIFYINCVNQPVLIVLLLFFKNMGAVGICYAVLISAILSCALFYRLIIRILNLKIRDVIIAVVNPMIAGMSMFFVVKSVDNLLFIYLRFSFGLVLSLLIVTGIFTYFLMLFLIDRPRLNSFKENTIDVLKSEG